MPIYEYECQTCDHHFDVKKSFDENGESPCCPRCKGHARRIISSPAIVFKGSGFYVTDKRKDDAAAVEARTPKADVGKKPEASKKVETAAKPEAANKSESKESKRKADSQSR